MMFRNLKSLFLFACMLFAISGCVAEDLGGGLEGQAEDAAGTQFAANEARVADSDVAAVRGENACASDGDCEEGFFCGYDSGCEGSMECVSKPLECSDVVELVCGCDGTTYRNACNAGLAGVSVGTLDACPCVEPETACPSGQRLSDTDGDGCLDTCVACPAWDCPAGFSPSDSDEDGCYDACNVNGEGQDCEGQIEQCPEGQEPVDSDGDGCNDTCQESEPLCVLSTECEGSQYCKKAFGDCDGFGKCAPLNKECVSVVAEVCGCDGITYPSSCEAEKKGVNVLAQGSCGSGAGCVGAMADSCALGEYCDPPPGFCTKGEMGSVCVDASGNCSGEAGGPVCGCDGKSYKNDCTRQAAMVAKNYDGLCEEVLICDTLPKCGPGEVPVDTDGDGCEDACSEECKPLLCPFGEIPTDLDGDGCPESCESEGSGDCDMNSPCNADLYCVTAVGQCGGKGVCEPMPELCPPQMAMPVDSVCGCDGFEYPNKCEAALAGVSVQSLGPCKPGPDGKMCKTSNDCLGANQYCELPPGFCGLAEGALPMPMPAKEEYGACVEKPMVCDEEALEKVCGCDGQDYPSPCHAAMKGVSISFTGSCGEVSEGMMCAVNEDCPGSSVYCALPPGMCDMATGGPIPWEEGPIPETVGMCMKKPFDCAGAELIPVCGCDGTDYENLCDAQKAGVSVAFEGSCSDFEDSFSEEKMCNESLGLGCKSEDEFCESPPGTCGAPALDMQGGYCVYKPQDCTQPSSDGNSEECGCDGVTYPSACERLSKGISLSYVGACVEAL